MGKTKRDRIRKAHIREYLREYWTWRCMEKEPGIGHKHGG
jgi:hypothetical protein